MGLFDFLNPWNSLADKEREQYQANQAEIAKLPDWQKKDLSKENPLPWQRYIDPGVSDLVNQQLGRVYNKSSNAFDVENNINPDDSYKVKPTDTEDNYKNTIERGVNFSGAAPKPTGNAMLDAINNKYASQYANKYAGLSTQNQINKPVYQSNQLARTGSILGNIQQNEMQNFKEQYQFQQQRAQLYNQWKQAKDQAKGSFLSNILQIGAGVVATIATGGAAAPAILPGLAGAFDSNGVGNLA